MTFAISEEFEVPEVKSKAELIEEQDNSNFRRSIAAGGIVLADIALAAGFALGVRRAQPNLGFGDDGEDFTDDA